MCGRLVAGRIVLLGFALSSCALALSLAPVESARAFSAGSRHARTSRPPRGHAAIVGGTTLLSVNQVPWTVYIFAADQFGSAWDCDGVIVDSTHVLTAAHCLYDSVDEVASPDDFAVYGDVTNLNDITLATPSETVSSVSTDPGYDPFGTSNASLYDAYDIGVLTLSTPLTFGSAGSAPQPIAIGTPSDAAQAASLSVSGFGDETAGAVNVLPDPTQPDGTLNELTLEPFPAGECALDVDALVGCASSAAGATCFGDSGGAITSTGPTPVLLGVVDAGGLVGGRSCEPSAEVFYAKVATPELSDFITGRPIVAAPQGGEHVGCSVPTPFAVGGVLQCAPGSWTGSPTYAYTFVDDTTGAVLQTGSPSFTLTSATLGHRIYFEVTASNAGGSAVARTVDSSAVQPAPTPVTVTFASTTSTPTANGPGSATGTASVTSSTTTVTSSTSTLTRQPPAVVRPRLRLSAASSRVRPGAKDTIRAVLSSGSKALSRVRVCVTAPPLASIVQAGGATVHGHQACWVQSLRANGSVTLTLREGVSTRAKAGTLVTTATAGGGLVAAVRIGVS